MPLAGRVPRSGTIAFHDPKPTRGSFNRGQRPQPTIIRFTTDAIKGRRTDEPTGTAAGTIDEEGKKGQKTESDVRKRILSQTEASSNHVVSPEGFASLWEALGSAGLFKLPRARGGIPPPGKPSIHLSAEGQTWVYLRPVDVTVDQLPRDGEAIRELQLAWGRVKLVLVNAAP